MLFLCYPKCSTCQKAKKWLDKYNIEYTERHPHLRNHSPLHFSHDYRNQIPENGKYCF